MGVNFDLDPAQVVKDIDFINKEYPNLFSSLSSMNSTLESVRAFWTGTKYTKLINAWNETVDNFLNPNLEALSNSENEMARIFNNIMIADDNPKRAENISAKKLTPKNPTPIPKVKVDTAKIISANTSLVSNITTAINSTNAIITHLLTTGWSGNASTITRFTNVAKKAKAELPPALTKLKNAINDTISADAKAYEKAGTN